MDDRTSGAGRRVAAFAIPALALLAGILYLTAPRNAPVATTAPITPEAVEAQGTEAAAPASAETASTETEGPAFDVVRVEPDGSAVVAGTAAPGAEVTIFADAAPVATATADADGNFVAIFEAPLSAAPQALTLGTGTDTGEGARSGEVVLLLPEPPRPAETEAAPPAVAAGAPAQQAEPIPEDQAAVMATAIVRSDSVEVTPAGPVPASTVNEVSLGTITYAEAGEVTLAGFGTAGSLLRAYVDDSLAREATVGPDGRWSIDLVDVAEGVYTLRIDQLGAEGTVESRVETPFQRDYPRAPLPRPGEPRLGASGGVTVQPGHNLWTLARLHYGSGMLYTQILTANRELIREPDLIYPGQIFDLPELETGQ